MFTHGFKYDSFNFLVIPLCLASYHPRKRNILKLYYNNRCIIGRLLKTKCIDIGTSRVIISKSFAHFYRLSSSAYNISGISYNLPDLDDSVERVPSGHYYEK